MRIIITTILSDNKFIDDENIFDESIKTHYAFTNVSRSYDDAMRDAFIDFDYSQESNNYCPEDFDPNENVINKFKKSTKKVDDFKNTLVIPQGLENEDSFYYAFLYAIRYRLKNRKDECCDDKLKKYIENDKLFDSLLSAKDKT